MYYYSLALMNHNAEHCCNVEARPPPRPAPSYGGRDETCPISTEGGTRRVHLVRRGGGRGAHQGHQLILPKLLAHRLLEDLQGRGATQL